MLSVVAFTMASEKDAISLLVLNYYHYTDRDVNAVSAMLGY